MSKTMQQLWDYAYALFLLFLGGETKDYTHSTACIMKYGAVRKFSRMFPPNVFDLIASRGILMCVISLFIISDSK